MRTDILILAAGKGTRMSSELPKVLTPVGGKAIIIRLLDTVQSLCDQPIIVVGHRANDVMTAVGNRARFVFQREQKGTGHAVREAIGQLGEALAPSLIVMPGDHPMVQARTFETITRIHHATDAVITLGTLVVPHFDGVYSVFNYYGRVIRDEKKVITDIREFKDATADERAILEVNPGYYCFNTEWLTKSISKLTNANASSELYLTDMIGIAATQGAKISTVPLHDYSEAMGINTPEQKMIIETNFFADVSLTT